MLKKNSGKDLVLKVTIILFSCLFINSAVSANEEAVDAIAVDVVIKTKFGNIELELFPDVAPGHVENFLKLTNSGFYDGTIFHRVIPGFMIQGGDPTGTGMGGPGWWLPIENSSLPHDFGVISMARAGDPDSAGSQFFLCLSRQGTARLDGQYCAFGETIEGDDVIRAISTTPLADPSSGKPVNPPKIHTIRLEQPAPRNLHVGNQSKIAH